MASIPEYVRRTLQDQIEKHARTARPRGARVCRFVYRGEYAYIDAFESDPWVMPDTSEEEKERIRHTPTKLCRLT